MRFWVYAFHLHWLSRPESGLFRPSYYPSAPDSDYLRHRLAAAVLFSLFLLAWLRTSQIAFSCLFLCAVTRIPNYFWIISFIYVPHCSAQKFRCSCSDSPLLLSSVSQLVAYLFSFFLPPKLLKRRKTCRCVSKVLPWALKVSSRVRSSNSAANWCHIVLVLLIIRHLKTF